MMQPGGRSRASGSDLMMPCSRSKPSVSELMTSGSRLKEAHRHKVTRDSPKMTGGDNPKVSVVRWKLPGSEMMGPCSATTAAGRQVVAGPEEAREGNANI